MAKGNSTISITYKFKGDNSGLKDLVQDVRKMQDAFEQGFEKAEQLKKSLINWNQVAQSFQAIGDSVSQLNNVVQDLAGAYSVQIQAETQLETVMRQRMGATAESIQGIKDLCAAQQELGVIGDEVQLAGAQQLSTFLSTDSALKALIPAMNNLAAQQKGLGATGSDLVSIANLMGKAMQGQASALRRVGITFTEAEEAAIRNGNEQERAATLAKIITNNVGEMNAALAATDAGRQQQVANAMGDIKEQLGGIVSKAAPYMNFASSIIVTAASASRAAASFRGLYSATIGANGALKMISAQAVAARLGLNAAGTAARFLAASLRAVVAATGVGLVIAGISAAIDALAGSANKARGAVEEMNDATKRISPAQEAANAAMREASAQITMHLSKLENFKGSKKQERELVNELNDTYGKTIGYFSSVHDWYKALQADSEAYTRQMVQEAKARKLADQIADIDLQISQTGVELDAKGKPVKPGQGLVDLGIPTFDSKGKPSSTLPQAGSTAAGLQTAIDNRAKEYAYQIANILQVQRDKLQAEFEKVAKEAVEMPVRGSSVRPNLGGDSTSGSGKGDRIQEKTILEEIEEQIRANEKAALTATDAELEALRSSTLALEEQKRKLKERQGYLTRQPEYIPPQLDEIKTYEQLEKALSYYHDTLSKSEEDGRQEINATIKELEKLRGAWDAALNPGVTPSAANPLDDAVAGIRGRAFSNLKSEKSPLAGASADSLLAQIKVIDNLLSGMDGDITEEQRKSLQEARAELSKYAKSAAVSLDSVRSAWGGVKSIASGINNITDALHGEASAWEKVTSVVDGVLQIFDALAGIVNIIKTITAATQVASATTQAAAAISTTATATEVGNSAAKAAASGTVATAYMVEAAAGAMKAHSWIPFVGVGLAGAAIGAMIALMATLPKFADGGLAYGPTLGLFGEYPGAANDPEVVAPLSKLKGMIGGDNQGGGELTCKVSGSDLLFVLNREQRKRSRR